MKQTGKSVGGTRKPRAAKSVKPIIARRRVCDPKGIGLSHYVFSEKKAR